MVQKPDKFSRFWIELKRRKTDRVIVVYAAAAFAILQLADILTGNLSLPKGSMTFVIIILAAGFPAAAIISWIFDITPAGIEKTKPLSDKKKHKIETQLRTWRGTAIASFTVIIGLIFFNIVRNTIQAAEIEKSEKSIAVLPFEILTQGKALPFNSDEVTSIITNGLIATNVFRVASRATVMEYAGKKLSIPEIAKRLDAFFVVTGEMISNKNEVLINVNLMQAGRNKVLWGGKYPVGPEDDIEKLNEIPQEIATRLKTVLPDETRKRISKKITSSKAAYLNYLKGTANQDNALNALGYLAAGDSMFKDVSAAESFDKAIEFYTKAINADTSFGLAYAKRAITRSLGYHAKHFTLPGQDKLCRDDIEKALSIDGNLTEAKVAYGFYHYYFSREYEKALGYFSEASKDEPANWQYKYYMALVLRASGDWESSQKLMREVARKNPRDPLVLTNIGGSYGSLHNYDTAIYYHTRAIKIMPYWSAPYYNKIECLYLRDGNTHNAEMLLDTAVSMTKGGRFQRLKILLDLYNGKIEDALMKATVSDISVFDDQGDRCLILAETYRIKGDKTFARECYRSAYGYYKNKLTDNPDDPDLLAMTGICLAGLNENKAAIEAGQKAFRLSDYNCKEKYEKRRDLAQIYVMAGENSKALPLLEDLLKYPSDISAKFLKLEPAWIPLRDNPAFKQLIIKYSK